MVSHPQATAQCARFLREHLPHAEHVSAPSTADAVQSVCESADERDASRSARGSPPSSTTATSWPRTSRTTRTTSRASCGSRAPTPCASPGADAKTSVVFWGGGDESPGWLVDLLCELSSRGVNLTRIESRPRRTGLGHYMFFADLEGAAGTPPVSEALDALAGHVEELRVLGSYGRPLWLD